MSHAAGTRMCHDHGGPAAGGAFDPTLTDVSLGTTIVAVSYRGGVILAADSRTSTGSYVANRAQDKITPLTDRVYLCRSGSASDTQAIAAHVQHLLSSMQAERARAATSATKSEGDKAAPSVRAAANLCAQIAYGNKNALQAGLIVAGFDADLQDGSVYAIPLGGTLLRVPYAIGGSGSAYITGFCDKRFREGMSEREAKAFVVAAVGHAIARDASSGGCIRTVTIDKDGARRDFVPGDQVPTAFGELPAVRRAAAAAVATS